MVRGKNPNKVDVYNPKRLIPNSESLKPMNFSPIRFYNDFGSASSGKPVLVQCASAAEADSWTSFGSPAR